jgi:hypothetical protein
MVRIYVSMLIYLEAKSNSRSLTCTINLIEDFWGNLGRVRQDTLTSMIEIVLPGGLMRWECRAAGLLMPRFQSLWLLVLLSHN